MTSVAEVAKMQDRIAMLTDTLAALVFAATDSSTHDCAKCPRQCLPINPATKLPYETNMFCATYRLRIALAKAIDDARKLTAKG